MKKLRKIFKIAGITLLSLTSFIVIYLLTEKILAGQIIEDHSQQGEKNRHIYIKSNGVHTDLVLPVKNDYMDWSSTFPFDNTLSQRTDYQYVGIGWGDKGFYLNTPEWKDLTVKTAFLAVSGLGSTALHVTYYDAVHEDELTKKIRVTDRQYLLLAEYVRNALRYGPDGEVQYIHTDAQYDEHDAFYEAMGVYSLFFTCNTWTNAALKYAGIKCCRWVAFDKGLISAHQ